MSTDLFADSETDTYCTIYAQPILIKTINV